MFVIKESKLANATSEVRTTEVNTYKDGKAAPPVLSLYAYDHFMQLGGHALLHDIFRLLITS